MPEIEDGIAAMGFETATPIQEQAIPVILDKRDLVGCAQTGTGKTAAFLLPAIHHCMNDDSGKIKCLILAPTRELAIQIDNQINGLGYFCGVASIPVYGGGQSDVFSTQKSAMSSGADIIVATPGRLLVHLNLGYVDLSGLQMLILDEADRMLDMGFIDDINRIISFLPKERQTLMFSATMAPAIRKLADSILVNPASVNIAIAKPAEGITQTAFLVHNKNKILLVRHLLESRAVQNMIIFASRKSSVNDIGASLKNAGLDVRTMHSGRTQEERNEIMRLFKAGKIQILVATDILARGIDIDGLSHVLNYDIPDDPADYVHRIGRTARADKTGEAIAFINLDDQFKWYNIEQLLEREIEKLPTPEEIGETPEYNPKKYGRRGRGGGGGGRGRGRSGGGGGGGQRKGRGGKPQGNRNKQGGGNSGNRGGGKSQGGGKSHGGGGGQGKGGNHKRKPNRGNRPGNSGGGSKPAQ